jgi:hypothetical protein
MLNIAGRGKKQNLVERNVVSGAWRLVKDVH